jgi:hypothetical protein
MWELAEALFDVVTSFGSDDRDRRDRRPGCKGCGFVALVVILFVVVFLFVFNL